MRPLTVERMTLAELHHLSRSRRAYFHDLLRWADEEQEPERGRLRKDLDSPKASTVWSAAQELYFGHMLQARGLQYDRHPTLQHTGKTPDFLVHHPTGDFIVEAAVVMDSAEQQVQAMLQRTLLDVLEPVVGPYVGVITVMSGYIPGDFSRRRLRQWAQQRITALAASGPPRDAEVTYRASDDPDALSIRFTLAPRPTMDLSAGGS